MLADPRQSLAFPLPSWVSSLKPPRLSEPPFPVRTEEKPGHLQGCVLLKAGSGYGSAMHGGERQDTAHGARFDLQECFVGFAVIKSKRLIANNEILRDFL